MWLTWCYLSCNGSRVIYPVMDLKRTCNQFAVQHCCYSFTVIVLFFFYVTGVCMSVLGTITQSLCICHMAIKLYCIVLTHHLKISKIVEYRYHNCIIKHHTVRHFISHCTHTCIHTYTHTQNNNNNKIQQTVCP